MVVAYYPLHYGAEYLRVSILSLIEVVDEIVFLYTPTGSYGHHGGVCPESEEQLRSIAMSFPRTKWVSGTYHHEGEHRGRIFEIAKEADLIVACDADEVFDTKELAEALEFAKTSGKRNHGVDGYVNFFRSFDYEVKDSFRPIRIINPRINDKSTTEVKLTTYHFGCCQSENIMRYKWECHGHKAELRENWLEDVYLNKDHKSYFHPASLQIWEKLIPFDKTKLPEVLKKHPNYDRAFVRTCRDAVKG
jgi:hypothetical protein